jgi:hypothetical protein
MTQYKAKVQDKRMLELPEEADELGLKPGDEVEVRLLPLPHLAQNGTLTPDEKARIAAIDAAMGSMAHLGVTSDDIRRERQLDDEISERQLRGDKP